MGKIGRLLLVFIDREGEKGKVRKRSRRRNGRRRRNRRARSNRYGKGRRRMRRPNIKHYPRNGGRGHC